MALPGVIAGLFPAVYGCPSLPSHASGAGQEGYKKHRCPATKPDECGVTPDGPSHALRPCEYTGTCRNPIVMRSMIVAIVSLRSQVTTFRVIVSPRGPERASARGRAPR